MPFSNIQLLSELKHFTPEIFSLFNIAHACPVLSDLSQPPLMVVGY